MSADFGTDRFVHPLHEWPTSPSNHYRGQLSPDFQERLALEAARLSRDDCDWYHSTVLTDGTPIQGQWDLRGHEAEYLGRIPLTGRRVLEFGPASGYLSFWMEQQGASVTSFEAGYDAAFEQLPAVDGTAEDENRLALMRHIARINNSWWFRHRELGSSARIAYGDIYNVPDDLGRFEVSFFGCILLHLRDPFRALHQAAAHTDQTIVVTDNVYSGLEDADDPVLRFGMDSDNPGPSVRWWDLSPGVITRMLWRLGFERTHLLHHAQRFEVPNPPVDIEMFTVVAQRRGVDETRGSIRRAIDRVRGG
jgi:O-methyltransferase